MRAQIRCALLIAAALLVAGCGNGEGNAYDVIYGTPEVICPGVGVICPAPTATPLPIQTATRVWTPLRFPTSDGVAN